ncbi:unnamed protein product [Caenorhabditis nigoni]
MTNRKPLAQIPLLIFVLNKSILVFSSSRLQECATILLNYDFQIEYSNAFSFGQAVALSQLVDVSKMHLEEESCVVTAVKAAVEEEHQATTFRLPFTATAIRKAIQADRITAAFIEYVQYRNWPKNRNVVSNLVVLQYPNQAAAIHNYARSPSTRSSLIDYSFRNYSSRSRSPSIILRIPTRSSKREKLILSGKYKKSSRWMALACLKFSCDTDRDADVENPSFDTAGYTSHVINIMKELTREVEIDNCNTIVIPHKILTPTHQNYRGLDIYINKQVMPTVKKNRERCCIGLPTSLNFTGDMFVDISVTTAKTITAKAKERIQGINAVHDILNISKRKYLIQGEEDSVVEQELQFFADENLKKIEEEQEKAPKNGYLPVRVYKMSEQENEPFHDLQKVVETSSTCLVEGLCDTVRFERNAFTLRTLTEAMPGYQLNVSRQVPEGPEVNMLVRVCNKKCSDESHGWRHNAVNHKASLEEFLDSYEKSKALSGKLLQYIKMYPENAENAIAKFQQELKKYSLPIPRKHRAHPDATIIASATIDIDPNSDNQNLRRLMTNIYKLPEFLRPSNNDDLLQHIPTVIAGLNTIQLSAKVPGSKSYACVAKGCLESLNINLGPGDIIWYSTPLEYSGKLQELARKMISSGKRGQCLKNGFWPNEEDCLASGIPIQKFVQKELDIVSIGAGTYHWTQSMGFSVQVSWNIARKSFRQLALITINHDNCLSNKITPLLPIETLVWNMAKSKTPMDDKLKRLVKIILCRSLANCQFEVDYVETQNYRKEIVNSTQNFAKIERYSEQNFYCFRCAKEKRIEVVYQKYTIKELSRIYNAVRLN